MSEVRVFETGAKRDTDLGKLDFDGFYCPRVVEAFGVYMNHNRQMADGSRRDSDNWQKGIPLNAYMKSGWRHFFDWWREHRGLSTKEGLVWALLGLLFNIQGYLHEILKADPELLDRALRDADARRDQSKTQTEPTPYQRAKATCRGLQDAFSRNAAQAATTQIERDPAVR